MQPLNTERVNSILKQVSQWAACRDDLVAVALVGSWARQTARVDSDIDLMFLTDNPASFRQNDRWMNEIHWAVVDAKVNEWKDKDYGAIWSRHVYLNDGTAIEFGFGFLSWASVNPVDAGTFRVVSDGCQVLYDPEDLLGKLIATVRISLEH